MVQFGPIYLNIDDEDDVLAGIHAVKLTHDSPIAAAFPLRKAIIERLRLLRWVYSIVPGKPSKDGPGYPCCVSGKARSATFR